MTPLPARMAGVIRSPRRTLSELAAAPRPAWLDVLVANTALMGVSLAALLSTTVGKTAMVDQMDRTAIAFGQTVDDAVYARMQELSSQGVVFAVVIALLVGPVLTMVISGLLTPFLRGRGTPRRPFTSVLSIVSHAGVILTVRQIIAAPINFVGETLASPMTLAQVVPGLDETSALARFLGVLDLFVVWWAVVLAIGVAALGNRRASPLALTFTGVYVAVALLLALAMAAAGGSA